VIEGEEGRDGTLSNGACSGDSGGPLACYDSSPEKKKFLCGIVKAGIILDTCIVKYYNVPMFSYRVFILPSTWIRDWYYT
jgi:hypothetical protein